MFTPEERERVSARVLERARSDDRISAAAILGSAVTGTQDRWSDIDLTFGVDGGLDGENATYARGIDRLPAEVTGPFEDALVRSLEPDELRRALGAATRCLLHEVRLADEALAKQLEAPLLEAAGG